MAKAPSSKIFNCRIILGTLHKLLHSPYSRVGVPYPSDAHTSCEDRVIYEVYKKSLNCNRTRPKDFLILVHWFFEDPILTKCSEIKVNKRSLVSFSIWEKYFDEAWCHVVPTEYGCLPYLTCKAMEIWQGNKWKAKYMINKIHCWHEGKSSFKTSFPLHA